MDRTECDRKLFREVLPVRPYVTEHQLIPLQCEDCGQVTEADSPAGVMGRVQYGPGVKAGSPTVAVPSSCPTSGWPGCLPICSE